MLPSLSVLISNAVRRLGNWLVQLWSFVTRSASTLLGVIARLLPWAGGVALLLILTYVFLPEARGWADRRIEALRTAFAEEGPPGFLYLEAPQVYTRERLVNDRFTQANWLRAQLDRTGDVAFMERFAAPTAISDRRLEASVSNNPTQALALPASGQPSLRHDSGATNVSPPLISKMEPLDFFEEINVYRENLRSELMDIQLDDGHDLDGNTLYRLNFNAVVMPFADRRSHPGSAVFVISARKPEKTGDDDSSRQLVEDDRELLLEWRREMQSFLSRVLEDRVATFMGEGALENPTDPMEDLALDWFLRVQLVERFLQHLSRDDEVRKQIPKNRCSMKTNEKAEACRIDYLAEQANFDYRSDKKSPGMQPSELAGFKRAVEVANAVNRAHWPRLGQSSYDWKCVDSLRTEHRSSSSPPDIVKSSEGSEQLNKEIAQTCLRPYQDAYRLRALLRLLKTVDALNSPPPWAVKAVRATGSEKPKKDFKDKLARFSEVIPELDLEPSPLKQCSCKNNKISNSVSGLQIEIGQLRPGQNALESLNNACKTKDNYANKSPGIIDYARCQFMRAPLDNMQEVIATFIQARVNGDLNSFYSNEATPLTSFLDVTTDGCGLSNCRINVKLKTKVKQNPGNDDVCFKLNLDDNSCLATRLVAELDKKTNGLVVYEVSPRSDGIVRRDANSRTVQAGLETPSILKVSLGEQARDAQDYRDPIVMGFSQLAQSEGQSPSQNVVFGWTVRPQPLPNGRWSPSHHRLSAVISVPSWWKRLDLEIHGCWVSPTEARSKRKELFGRPEQICRAVHGEPDTATKAQKRARDGVENEGTEGDQPDHLYFKRTVRVQLPRSIEEVTTRFNFDFVKAPYFDRQWSRETERVQTVLMEGRPAHIALAGKRLWRGTVVTLNGQPADRITVLPDMKGVIAEFKCLLPLNKASSPMKSSPLPWQTSKTGPAIEQAQLMVWTAEGRTKPIVMNIRPFTELSGIESDHPCYASSTEDTKEIKDN